MQDDWTIFGLPADDGRVSINFVGGRKGGYRSYQFDLTPDQLRTLYLEAGWELQTLDRKAEEIVMLAAVDPALAVSLFDQDAS